MKCEVVWYGVEDRETSSPPLINAHNYKNSNSSQNKYSDKRHVPIQPAPPFCALVPGLVHRTELARVVISCLVLILAVVGAIQITPAVVPFAHVANWARGQGEKSCYHPCKGENKPHNKHYYLYIPSSEPSTFRRPVHRRRFPDTSTGSPSIES